MPTREGTPNLVFPIEVAISAIHAKNPAKSGRHFCLPHAQ
jgi:hypothetical protein